MRLDARIHPDAIHFRVWHAEQCQFLKYVVMVDDEYHLYAIYKFPMKTKIILTVIQAKQILILKDYQLVIINPIDCSSDEEINISNSLDKIHG